MKNYYFNRKNNRIAVYFLILIQLAAFECGDRIKCSKNIPTVCSCNSEPKFNIECAKNNEKFSLTESADRKYLDLNCIQISDGKILEFVHLSSIVANHTNITGVQVQSNNLSTLPQNIFKNLENLSYLDLAGNALTTLPRTI